MNKKKYFVIFIFIFVLMLFTATNVYAAREGSEWLQYGETVTCGNISNIPMRVPNTVSMLINVLHVAVPVILVIFGVLDLTKGIMSGKEDDIKKGRQVLIRRLIAGACIFLIVVVVKVLVTIVDENQENQGNMISCINCFISGECSGSTTVPVQSSTNTNEPVTQ